VNGTVKKNPCIFAIKEILDALLDSFFCKYMYSDLDTAKVINIEKKFEIKIFFFYLELSEMY
jgi:hypothetical protein